jgi:hypothetical protein
MHPLIFSLKTQGDEASLYKHYKQSRSLIFMVPCTVFCKEYVHDSSEVKGTIFGQIDLVPMDTGQAMVHWLAHSTLYFLLLRIFSLGF